MARNEDYHDNPIQTEVPLVTPEPVISLGGDDVPHIYHESFPADYLMDKTRCEDPRLRIDIRIRHTHLATQCFEIMNKHLKRNILGLGDPARFMSNEDGLKEDGITEEKIQEKIPPQLRYACVYWANHLEIANIEDVDLTNKLERFMGVHILHWFEVLSLIEKLDSAHHGIGVVLKLLILRPLDLHQLLSDALRFISKFYGTIERSALHMYYSALSFTPTNSLIYRRYNKETEHNICAIEGGPEVWDALVATSSHGEVVDAIKFSLDSALLASCSQGKLKIWDAVTGTPISTIPGHRFAVANDFSTVASSQDNTITYYDLNGTARGTMFTTSSKIQKLALSSKSSRIAAALSDGTVWLWDSGNAELIGCFDGSDGGENQLEFSPTGTRLAYSSVNSIVKLRDGVNGSFIADLQCGSNHKFEFSPDGSRVASVSDDGLMLCDSQGGGLIAAARNVDCHCLAISGNGSLLATAGTNQVTLWNENSNNLVQIKDLEVDQPLSMAFSWDNVLAIATSSVIKLYYVETHSFIHTLLLSRLSTTLAFSPDCTRLVAVDEDGNVNIYDIRGIGAPCPLSTGTATAVTALALSRDCSRMACGFGDGTVELWETSPTKRRIVSGSIRSKMDAFFGQSRHTESVRALEFDPDGRLFASGSGDSTINVWNGEDGTLHRTLKAPSGLQAITLSNSVLVAGWDGGVTLWSLDTLSPIHTFTDFGDIAHTAVSISENSALIAVAHNRRVGSDYSEFADRDILDDKSNVSLLDVVNHATIATFDVPSNIHTMAFLPDNLQLMVQSDDGAFLSLNLVNKGITKGPTLEHIIQLPNTPLWHGVPIWHCQDKKQRYISALFSQLKSPVPVLRIPKQIPVTAWTQGPSMIALGCEDGHFILLRLPTSHVG